ncbi:MAG TPA: AI-2E family transporter [Terriglobia bacterium]|nr:AI-2E family transporter [Terriglobia bacterium]
MVRGKRSPASSELLTLIAVIVVIAVLYFAREVLVPMALAVLLSFLLTPVVVQLEKARLGRIPAVLMVLVLAVALVVAGGWGLAGQLTEIVDHLPTYTANIQKKIQSLHSSGGLNRAINAVKGLNDELSAPGPERRGARGHSQVSHASKERGISSPENPMPAKVEASTNGFKYLRGLLGPAASILARVVIVIVFTLFMLAKREDLRNRVIRLASKGQLNLMTQALDDASTRISRYLLLQLLVNSSYGVLFGLGLYLLGIPHALLWGVLGGILRFIPYFGTLIGAVFPIALALAVFPGWSHALYVLGLYLVIELIIAYVMEPWLYGVHTGISPFAILVAAVFWTMLWGPVGLILSVPLTVCLMVMGRHIPHLEFIGILLGDEPVLAPAANFYQRLLAMDLEEARDIARAYLKEKPLGSLYQSVLIPALSLEEQDRHAGSLDQETEAFICQGIKELIEEFGESTQKEALTAETDGKAAPGAAVEPLIDTRLSSVHIICVPARDDSDAMIALMLAQLLDRAGYDAKSLAIGAVEDMLEKAVEQKARVVCVSALPPFALGQARSLCRRLRTRLPELKIVLGLWNFEGGVSKAQERVGTGYADRVVTTLSDVLGQVHQLALSIPPVTETPDPRLTEEEHR